MAPINVEVITLSSKPNENRGKATLMIHKPNIKKGATIQASLYTGSQFVLVKVLMEKFVKTFIDSLMSEPDENALGQFKMKSQAKKCGKDDVNVPPCEEVKCETCEKYFPSNLGLRVHIGKMHKDENILPSKRKRTEEVINEENKMKRIKLKVGKDNKNMCAEYGTTFSYLNSYNWHIKKCHKRKQEFTEVKENTTNISKKVISKSCPDCDVMIEAQNFKTLLENMQIHNDVCKVKLKICHLGKNLLLTWMWMRL